ncbi:MAG: hypothetical protein DMG61_03310 [Acidobacteria bacterium]|nr:MAG: hypothetical protein DMG61_03310 [Acidobacteriota bacterium]
MLAANLVIMSNQALYRLRKNKGFPVLLTCRFWCSGGSPLLQAGEDRTSSPVRQEPAFLIGFSPGQFREPAAKARMLFVLICRA